MNQPHKKYLLFLKKLFPKVAMAVLGALWVAALMHYFFDPFLPKLEINNVFSRCLFIVLVVTLTFLFSYRIFQKHKNLWVCHVYFIISLLFSSFSFLSKNPIYSSDFDWITDKTYAMNKTNLNHISVHQTRRYKNEQRLVDQYRIAPTIYYVTQVDEKTVDYSKWTIQ